MTVLTDQIRQHAIDHQKVAAIWYEVAATRTGLGMSKKYVTSAQEYAAEQARCAMNSLTELLYLEGLQDEWL